MNIHEDLLKFLNKVFHKKEFWFTVLFYPAIAAGYFYLKNNKSLYQLGNRAGIWYFVISFIIFIYIIVIVSFEILEKRLMNKVQGDKLKIKQNEWRHK